MRALYRVSVLLFLLVAVATVARSTVDVVGQSQYFRVDVVHELEALGHGLVGLAAENSDALEALAVARRTVVEHSDVAYEFVPLADDELVAGTGMTLAALRNSHEQIEFRFVRPDADGDERLEVYLPVSLPNVHGVLVLERDISRERSALRRRLWAEALSSVALILLFALATWYLNSRLLAEPFERVLAHVLRLGEGDYAPAPVDDRDEFGRLHHVLNEVGQKIQRASAQIRSERTARSQVEADVEELTDTVDEMAGELEDAWVEAAEEHQKRRELEAQLAHADRLATVGRLAASLIHDLGTPLNVISGHAQLLGDAGEEDAAQVIQEQAHKIAVQVRRLLDFTRRPELDRAEEDLAALARDVCDLLASVARQKNVIIHAPAASQEPVRARIDAMGIEQLLMNLIGNAIDACGAADEIFVTVAPQAGDRALIEVRDTGPGIPDSIRNQLFEPFVTTKGKGRGTGLGLSVSRSIVGRHGGSIEVHSDASGARFTVSLPQGGPSAPAQQLHD